MSVLLVTGTASVVKIAGIEYQRSQLTVTLDGINQTLTVEYDFINIIDNVGYAGLSGDGVVFANYPAMALWVNTHMIPVIPLEAVNVFQVKINGITYTRKDLTITLDGGTQTLSVDEGVTPILSNTSYVDLYPVETDEAFPTYADLEAWVLLNMQDNVVLVLAGNVAKVMIDEVNYFRPGLTVTFDDEAETVTVVSGGVPIIDDVIYSNIVDADGGTPFATYAEMKSFFYSYVQFRGVNIVRAASKGWYKVGGKPFPKGTMYLEWNDTNETLEIRYSKNDYSDKIMPATRYDMIVTDTNITGVASYQDLIDYVAENLFKH